MRSFRLAIATLVAAFALSAHAESYTFDVLYSGGDNASLADGSQDPVGQSILPGDSFLWTISAQPGFEWQVVTGRKFFALMAFAVDGSGARTGDWTLNLMHEGVSVFEQSETDSVQRWVHMGTNEVDLASGLAFDKMVLQYTLTSYTPGDGEMAMAAMTTDGLVTSDTVIQGMLPVFGAPETPFGPDIVYAPVPEPASYGLALVGLAVVVARVRRHRAGTRH